MKHTEKPLSKTFSHWTIDEIVRIFGVNVAYEGMDIRPLLLPELSPTETEVQEISFLRSRLVDNITLWNEDELEFFFLSPFINMVNFYEKPIKPFKERPLKAQLDEWTLSGEVDWVLSHGFGSPVAPFFCLKEFKKARSPLYPPIWGDKGGNDPEGQLAAAMLVAEVLNDLKYPQLNRPIYGAYLLGREWTFVQMYKRQMLQAIPLLLTDESSLQKILMVMKKMKDMALKEARELLIK